jgi:hypothetical protein
MAKYGMISHPVAAGNCEMLKKSKEILVESDIESAGRRESKC